MMAPLEAQAVQTASVQVDSAPVLSRPDAGAEIIEEVPYGTQIYASNKPTRGHYKVKAPSGKIGWINAANLGLPPGDAVAPPAPPSAAPRTRARSAPRASSASASVDNAFGVRILGGISAFKLANINTLYEITEMGSGFGFGFEGMYRFSPSWSGVFHFETYSRAVEVEVEGSGETFTLKTSATPIQVGMMYWALSPRDSGVALGFGGLIGFGLGTKFSSTANQAADTAANETIYSGSPLSLSLRVDFDLFLSKSISLGAQLGYRIQKLAEAAPVTEGDTTADDRLVTNGEFTPQEVNHSGLTYGLGISFWF